MRQVLLRVVRLSRRPTVLTVGALLALGGSMLVALPLFEVPGYELAEALTLAVGILGGAVGAAAAFQERRILLGQEAASELQPAATPLAATGRPLAAALLLNVTLLALPFLVATLYALVSTRCDPFALAGFYPVLTLPSAALASAAGVLCGFRARRGLFAAGHYLGLVLLSALVTAWPLVAGPQVFAFNHFGGYLPGPLYDEMLTLRAPVLWFRLQTILLAGLLWCAAALFLDPREGRLGRPRLRPVPLTALVLCGLGVVLLERAGPTLGFRMTREHLEERLGGRRVTEHFIITYPRGMHREEVERMARDAEFRRAQVASFLGDAPEEPIRVFLYRSAEEKQTLVGAARTQFAKPWLLELHISDPDFPHPSLKHELVHVMTAPFGSTPFRVTSRFGIWPVMGVIEGMAVAGDDPADELTLHAWAAGMRRQKLAPDIRRILGPYGFYESAPQRAYTLVGSFLRYLADTHGTRKLTALYASGDFQAVYGRPVDDLATEWERFLDGIPLDDTAVNQAFARFRRGSLFSRPCAREVANLQSEAADYLVSDPGRALELYQRCARLQPEEPSFLLYQADALARLGRRDEAAELLSRLQGKVAEQPSPSAEVSMAQAELAFQRDRKEEARQHLQRALQLETSAAVDRTARVKLAALDAPVGRAIWAWFRPGHEEAKILELREALDRDPRNPYLAYLLGRRLTRLRAPRLAVGYLTRALQEEMPDSLRREALRLKIEALYLLGDCSGVRHEVGQLPDLGAALKARAVEWMGRCDFEERTFKGPLVPEDSFR